MNDKDFKSEQKMSKEFARFITKAIASELSEKGLDLPSVYYEDIEASLLNEKFESVESFIDDYIKNNNVNQTKHYFELKKEDSSVFIVTNLNIKEGAIARFIGFSGWNAKEIPKSYYEYNSTDSCIDKTHYGEYQELTDSDQEKIASAVVLKWLKFLDFKSRALEYMNCTNGEQVQDKIIPTIVIREFDNDAMDNNDCDSTTVTVAIKWRM